MTPDQDEETVDAPHLSLPTQTLVLRKEPQEQLLWFEGLLPLPIGSVINIDNIPGSPQVPLDQDEFPKGRADARVVGVHVWGIQGDSRLLVLEVELLRPGSRPFAFVLN
jgi:hypothetical protein